LKSKQGQNWNSTNLDKWLSKPAGFVPGNKMGFAGLDGRKDRNDLIAFLGTV
jgi:cytochrome c